MSTPDPLWTNDPTILARASRLNELNPFDGRLSTAERLNALARVSALSAVAFAIAPVRASSKSFGVVASLLLLAVSATAPEAIQAIHTMPSACKLPPANRNPLVNRSGYWKDSRDPCRLSHDQMDRRLDKAFGGEVSDYTRLAFHQVPDNISGYNEYIHSVYGSMPQRDDNI